MWLSEKALVFVDTRSAAIAVYRQGLFAPKLLRFAAEALPPRASAPSAFPDVLEDSRAAVEKLSRDLKAPTRDATLLLPLGATFPSVVDLAGAKKAQASEVDRDALVRFRLAPLLPFPIAQAEVRTETTNSAGAVLAQAILKTTIIEAEKAMGAFGFERAHVTSALSAALRGLKPRPGVVDLVFGDSACAMAVRDPRGAIVALHLRRLAEGDDRGARSFDEAMRAAPEASEIRVLGDDTAAIRAQAGTTPVTPVFEERLPQGAADPQRYPFLAVFHEGQGR